MLVTKNEEALITMFQRTTSYWMKVVKVGSVALSPKYNVVVRRLGQGEGVCGG